MSEEQRQRLQDLLLVAEGNRRSRLDQLRSGPMMVSGPALVRALRRLDDVRGLGIALPPAAHIPPSRIAALARFAKSRQGDGHQSTTGVAAVGDAGGVRGFPGSQYARRCPGSSGGAAA